LWFDAQPIDDVLGHAERWIDGLQAGMSQQRESADAEERVEYVGHVACAIGETARLCILAGQNELLQLLGADPVQTTHDGQRGEHPPRVAHIRQLLGASVQPTRWQLALAQPPAQFIHVEQMKAVGQREEAHTAVNKTWGKNNDH